MRKSWMLVICLLAVSVIAATGCTTAPSIDIPNYSEAKALQKAGDYEAAIAKYQAYVAENPDGVLVPYAQFHIAESYLNMRDTAKAAAAYDDVVAKFANTDPAEWAKEDLDFLKNYPEVILPPAEKSMEPAEADASAEE